MQAKVITLRFDALKDAFDDQNLRDFIKDKKILEMNDHFFQLNTKPYLAVFVTYEQPLVATPAPKPKAQDERWRENLSEQDIPLFNTIRDWRKERCKRDGVPPYVICTNKQLALMVSQRPQTLSKLTDIEGFGKGRVEKYGREILELLKQENADESEPKG